MGVNRRSRAWVQFSQGSHTHTYYVSDQECYLIRPRLLARPTIPNLPPLLNATSPDAPTSFPPATLQSFSLQAVTESELLKELLKLDPKKTSGSDGLDPFFLIKVAIITKPISDLLNLSLLSGEVPIPWKAATVHSSFKEGDHADPNCYRPISILPCLSKVLEKLVNNQLTAFLEVYSILSGMQSGLRSGYDVSLQL